MPLPPSEHTAFLSQRAGSADRHQTGFLSGSAGKAVAASRVGPLAGCTEHPRAENSTAIDTALGA